MNRIDRRIQEVTTLVDQGLQKHSLAHKSALRIRELEECNREMLGALEAIMAVSFFDKWLETQPAYEQARAAIEKAREITWVRKGKL